MDHFVYTNITISELYRALMKKDDAKVLDICASISNGPLQTVTIHNDTVIHVAAYYGKNDLALSLLNMVKLPDYHKLTCQNEGGNTILHETGTNNNTVCVAREVIRRAPALLSMTNKLGETALYYAARHGKTKIFKYLHNEVVRGNPEPDLKSFLTREDKSTILHIAVLSKNYWMAHKIAIKHPRLINETDDDNMTPLQLLSCSKLEHCPTNFFTWMIYNLIDSNVEDKSWISPLNRIKKQKFACEWAQKLVKLLVENDNSWKKTESRLSMQRVKFHQYGKSSTTDQQKEITAYESAIRSPETPLILATKHRCTMIVEKILDRYPQAIEYINQDGHNILHVAIKFRNHEIFDYVVNRKYAKERLRGKIDHDANTLLHMVAEEVEDVNSELKGPALELQDNLLMFKKVKNICPFLDQFKMNCEQKTPIQVFHKKYNKLRTEAKDCMIEDAKNYTIFAVLIATVAFVGAYPIPGGVKPDTGEPVLKTRPLFMFFTIADTMSLSTALTSVIVFLSVITSSYRFKDFEKSLILMMNAGLTMLVVSVAMLMVAFGVTLTLTISGVRKWTDITLYAISFFPVIVFVFMYFNVQKIQILPLIGRLRRRLTHILSLFVNSKPKPTVWNSGDYPSYNSSSVI